MIRNEMIHETRIIPLDGRRTAVADAFAPTWATRAATGRATRWSCETTNFNGKTGAQAQRQLLIDERRAAKSSSGSRAPASTHIQYQVTVNDPKTWTRPWTAAFPLRARPGVPVLRIRVPRRQLRDVEHPVRIAGGRKELKGL